MRYRIDYVVALQAITGFAGSNVQSSRNYSLVIARGNVHLTNRTTSANVVTIVTTSNAMSKVTFTKASTTVTTTNVVPTAYP